MGETYDQREALHAITKAEVASRGDLCPFCGEPKSDYPVNGREDTWKCGTVPYYGEEERSRTHQCYMNQIRALQTGDETQYGQGWQDGVKAAFDAMAKTKSDWLIKHPPLRRPGAR